MKKSLGKIKVYFLNNPKKVISYLKNIESKEETLDKIRPKIDKMKDNHLFVDKYGDQIDFDLENETNLQEILDDKDEKNLKIFIAEPDSSNQENNQDQSNKENELTDDQNSSLKKDQHVTSDSQNPSENNEVEGGNSTEKNKEQQNSETSQIESTEKPDKNKNSNINPNEDGQTQKIKDQNEPKNETGSENNPKNETQETNPEENNDSLAQNNHESQGGQETNNVREPKDNKKDISVQENIETTNESESKNNENNNQTNNGETQKDKKKENVIHEISQNIDNNIDNNEKKNNNQTNDNIEENQNPNQNGLNKKLDQKDENKNTGVIQEENNSNTQKKEDSNNQSNAGQNEQNLDKNFEKEHPNEINDKGIIKEKEGEKNNNENEKNLNSINNNIINGNPTVEKKAGIEQKEITTRRSNKNNGQNYNLSIKQKTYFFTAIINQKYSENLKFTFKRINGQFFGYNIKCTIKNFEETISEGYIWNSKLNRVMVLYEVKIPSDINNFLIVTQKKNKEYSCSINTGNSKNLIIIKLKPFNEFKDYGNNIFYDLITEKEKDVFLLNLINYFGEKDVEVKNKFIEMFLKDQIIRPSKKILDVFSLVNIFDNNFLDINFLPIFIELDKFNFGNSIILNEDIKYKILKLYNDIKEFKEKEEIHKEIWIFLILYLIKMKEEDKVLEILSLIEKLKIFNSIIILLFTKIKDLIYMMPEVKVFFKHILKYQPNSFEFMVKHIDNYNQYIDLIINNMSALKDNIIYIFPYYMRYDINLDNENILHNIIKIIKEKKNNLIFNCSSFIQKFDKNYLKILNADEKTILLNYLKENENSLNNDGKKLIGEIVLDNINNCNDNKSLLFILNEYPLTIELIEQCSININLETLSDNDLDILSNVMKSYLKYYQIGTKNKIYFIYFNKIKILKDFVKLWRIFGICSFRNNNDVELHINKFWELYKKENVEENITHSIFYYMFLLLKNNNENYCIQFLKSINELDNYKLIINIYEIIFQKRRNKLNEDEKEIISCFYLNKFSEKNYFSLNLQETYSFLSDYFDDMIIEVEDFYKTSKEIVRIFKIFNYLNSNHENFKTKNFFKYSSKNFTDFLDSIENNEINLNQLIVLNDLVKSKDFDEKLEFFNFNENEKNNFIKNIESKYNLILEKKEQLEICQKYLEIFASTEDTKLKNSINLRIKEVEKPIKKFLKTINEIHFSDTLEKLFKRAKKYDEIKTFKVSTIFLNELENKKDKEKEKINYLENKINNMRKILSVFSIKDVDQNNFKDFLALFGNKDELIEEINN